LIKPRLLPSLEMGLTAMVIGVILGLILGVIAAVRQNTWADYTATVISVIAVSVPSFVLAVLLQCVFSVRLQWFSVAGSKGNSTMRVLFRHALRNALIPVITIIVPMLASILTGTLTIENIFGVPGLGDQFVRSITTNDFPVIMATTILFSTLFIVSIFLVD